MPCCEPLPILISAMCFGINLHMFSTLGPSISCCLAAVGPSCCICAPSGLRRAVLRTDKDSNDVEKLNVVELFIFLAGDTLCSCLRRAFRIRKHCKQVIMRCQVTCIWHHSLRLPKSYLAPYHLCPITIGGVIPPLQGEPKA